MILGSNYPGEIYPAGAFGGVATLGPPVCCSVMPPKRGTIGAIFTITTATGIGGIALEAYNGACGGSSSPVLQMLFNGVPANGKLVVDCAKRKVTLTAPDPVTGQMVNTDGTTLLQVSTRALEWIEIRDCDVIGCLCARATAPLGLGASASVKIDTQAREG